MNIFFQNVKNKTFEDWKRISGYTLANGSHPFLSGAALFTFKDKKDYQSEIWTSQYKHWSIPIVMAIFLVLIELK